ncbi:MAG: triose-phosphate isomerase [Deltaproteobacteria bacterium]|nr:triose-phosphate isomerase [Deltaproteobacteria bacterium]
MKPRYIIAGNWKLNKDVPETGAFIKGLSERLTDTTARYVDVIIAPPFTSLPSAVTVSASKEISIAAQDVFWEDRGAFTGEVSAAMLKGLGVRYCIVGHSERRLYFQETDRMINLKTCALLRNGVRPIVCVGERSEDRRTGIMQNVVRFQLSSALFDVEINNPDEIVIAYEPVWAIGTGNVATPRQAEDMHEIIRKSLEKCFGVDIGSRVRILYGGSVNTDNIAGLVGMDNINGALIGGVSLDLEKFISIITHISRKERG